MKKICVITGSRAEFGLLLPLLNRIKQCHDYQLCLVATGMHLSDTFGRTEDEIKENNIPYERVAFEMRTDSNADMAYSTGAAMEAFAYYFDQNKPDILVLLGDRYETFAACAAAAMQCIPIAHIHGGEITLGAVDDFLRHCITKMSTLHFTACEAYRKRVVQMGEDPKYVYNVGALGMENIRNIPIMSKKEIEQTLDFKIHSPYAIVTFHPVTTTDSSIEDVQELILAMEQMEDYSYIITEANTDSCGTRINDILKRKANDHENWHFVKSLGMRRYLSLLKDADFVLGNSSSGIIEAPGFCVPTINVGSRQEGRAMASSVICCDAKKEHIVAAVRKSASDSFRQLISGELEYWGDGKTSEKILAEIDRFLSKEHSATKKYYDLSFDIPD